MNINNITLNTTETDFCIKLPVDSLIKSRETNIESSKNDENSYEDVCANDFDDNIDTNDFQLHSSGTIDIEEDSKFSKLLDFVQKNTDVVNGKLNDNETSIPKDEEKTPESKKPVIPSSFNFSSLSGLIDPITSDIFNNDEKYESNYNVNREIESSKQGDIGDCWLLAGLNSLSYSGNGKEIIKNSITDNKDGTYNVNFKGVNLSYTVTDEALNKAKSTSDYSTGDDDVLIMEIATENFLRDLESGKINSLPDDAPDFLYNENGNPLDGGFPKDIVYLLTGKLMDYQNIICNDGTILKGEALEEFHENNLNDFYEKFEQNPDNSCGCIHIKKFSDTEPVIVDDINGNKVKLTDAGANHSWSVKEVNKDTITMVNPWDSSSSVTINKSTLQEHVLGFEYLEV